MKIRIDPHTILRADERGATEDEIEEVIHTGVTVAAGHGRRRKYKVFDFSDVWRGRRYAHKRVEVVYVEEDDVAVTVTVYVLFGRWPG